MSYKGCFLYPLRRYCYNLDKSFAYGILKDIICYQKRTLLRKNNKHQNRLYN